MKTKRVLTLTVSKQWFGMIVNCFESGFRCHVPIRFSDEIASYDSLTVLNKKTPHPVITTEWGLFSKT